MELRYNDIGHGRIIPDGWDLETDIIVIGNNNQEGKPSKEKEVVIFKGKLKELQPETLLEKGHENYLIHTFDGEHDLRNPFKATREGIIRHLEDTKRWIDKLISK